MTAPWLQRLRRSARLAALVVLSATGGLAASAATSQSLDLPQKGFCPAWKGFADTFPSPAGTHSLTVEPRSAPSPERVRVTDSDGRILLALPVEITNALWTEDGARVVAAASPASGAPGIYVYTLATGAIERIRWPTHYSDIYPDGSDWFVLCSVSGDTLRYMIAPDPAEALDGAFPFGAEMDSMLVSGGPIHGPAGVFEVFLVLLVVGVLLYALWYTGRFLVNLVRYRSFKAAAFGAPVLETVDLHARRGFWSGSKLRAHVLGDGRIKVTRSIRAGVFLGWAYQPLATLDRDELDGVIKAMLAARERLRLHADDPSHDQEAGGSREGGRRDSGWSGSGRGRNLPDRREPGSSAW